MKERKKGRKKGRENERKAFFASLRNHKKLRHKNRVQVEDVVEKTI